jgi:glycosyltransferase involved in cell wall biosynthesis
MPVSIHIPRRFVQQSWGGTETVVLESVKQLNALGHPARVYTSCALAPDPLAHSEQLDGVEVARFPHFYPYFGLSTQQQTSLDQSGGNLFSWSLMRALAGQKGTQLFHLHTAKRLGGIARTVAKLKRIPYVLSLHGGWLCRPESEARRQQARTQGCPEWGKALGWLVGSRRVVQQASTVICLTRAEKVALQSLDPKLRCRVLPNGVDLERFREGRVEPFRRQNRIPTQSKLIAVVGRVDPQKGQLQAVRAFGRLEDPEAHLLLVGPSTDHQYEAELQHEIRSSPSRGRITRLPGLSGQDLVDAYHSCDLLLIPSLHEPFGLVALEGWACGKAILASRVGGLGELITDGHDGLLVSPGLESELAAGMARLLQDAGLRQALACQGRRSVARYSWAEHTRKLLEIYQEAIDEHPFRQ